MCSSFPERVKFSVVMNRGCLARQVHRIYSLFYLAQRRRELVQAQESDVPETLQHPEARAET